MEGSLILIEDMKGPGRGKQLKKPQNTMGVRRNHSKEIGKNIQCVRVFFSQGNEADCCSKNSNAKRN